MNLAGPVFTEWYWGPIFFAIFVGPFILAGSILGTVFITRLAAKRGRFLTRAQQVGIAALVILVGIPLAIGGFWVKEKWDQHRMFQSSAEQITFQTYEPTYVPPGVEATSIWPLASPYEQSVQFDYESQTGGFMTLWQSPLANGDYCGIDIAASTQLNSPPFGPCEPMEVEGLGTVYMTHNSYEPQVNTAAVRVGGTGVVVQYNRLAEEEVLRFLGALVPVPPDEIDYFDERL